MPDKYFFDKKFTNQQKERRRERTYVIVSVHHPTLYSIKTPFQGLPVPVAMGSGSIVGGLQKLQQSLLWIG